MIETHDSSLKKFIINNWGSILRIWMAEVHVVFVVIPGAIDTTHHTLVITEEKDGQGSDTIDGYEQAALLKLVNDIVPRNEIHDGGVPDELSFGKGRRR